MTGGPLERAGALAARLDAPLVPIVIVWALPWLLFAISVNDPSSDLKRTWIGAALLVAANFVLLLVVFLRTSVRYPPWAVAGGFLFTFMALIGAFASADLVASHQHVLSAGKGPLIGCYTDASGRAIALRPVDAIYFTVSTVTTAGFGDVSPHSHLCRWLTSGQLGIGFPLLGLSIGGVAGRVFRELAPPTPPIDPAPAAAAVAGAGAVAAGAADGQPTPAEVAASAPATPPGGGPGSGQ